MGRGKIRRRTKHGRRVPDHAPERPVEDPGDIDIVADLRDQAQWSSYAQDIPRLGDDRREQIRLSRYARAASRFREGADMGPDFYTGAKIIAAAGFGLLALIVLIKWLF